MTVRIYLLGSIAVEVDGKLLLTERQLPSRAARIAVAYLAIERHRPIPKDELAGVIWSDGRPKTWGRSLGNVISQLRAMVDRMGCDGAAAIPMNLGSYQVSFGPDVWIDVQTAYNALEEARAALRQGELRSAWLRGNVAAGIAARPFLSGESGTWIEAQRRGLRDVRLGGLHVVGDAALGLNDHDVAINVSEEILETDPTSEFAFERLIRAHGAVGRSVSATDAFDRYQVALRDRGLVATPRVLKAYEEAVPRRSNAVPPRLRRTFMFTDIVDSTKLVEALGDSAWLDLGRWNDNLMRSCFAEFEGEEVDHAGDGFLAAFPDQQKAIMCAIEIQRRLDRHRREQGFAPRVRIGVHCTEADKEHGRYSGRGLHEAARIGGLATGDEILASTRTIEGTGAITESPPRTVSLKGFGDPVEVVEVSWRKERERAS